MASLTVTPNPANVSTLVAILGQNFVNAKTRLLLDGVTQADIFRPRKDGTFAFGITVSATPKTQILIAQQLSGTTWTEKVRVSIVVQVVKPIVTSRAIGIAAAKIIVSTPPLNLTAIAGNGLVNLSWKAPA